MADKTTSNIGFEKQIWDAACVLRGISMLLSTSLLFWD